MAKHVVKSKFSDTYEINTKNDEWTFEKSFSVNAEKFGIHVGKTFDGNDLTIAGKVKALGAVFIEGANTDVDILSSAVLSGSYGIGINGAGSHVTNDGTIKAKFYAVSAEAPVDVTFTNSGMVKGEQGGVFFNNAGGNVTNLKDGSIIGTTLGVGIDTNFGEKSLLINHGLIEAQEIAVITADGNDKVVNDGTIRGQILLGEGNDRFDNRGGEIVNDDHGVSGGNGNDTLFTDSAKVKLIEELDQGKNDTVKSTVGYTLSDNVETLVLLGTKNTKGTGTDLDNTIHGNSGNNTVKGLLGSDQLYGHKGNDILIGGGDVDTFHFSTGDGKDVISDFENAYDRVDLSGLAAITDFNDLMDNHIHFAKGNAIITAGQDTLTMRNVVEADLDQTDFIFDVMM